MKRNIYLFLICLPNFLYIFEENIVFPWYLDNLQSLHNLFYYYYLFLFILLLCKKETIFLFFLLFLSIVFYFNQKNENYIKINHSNYKEFSVLQYNMFFNDKALFDIVELAYIEEPDFIILQELSVDMGVRAYKQFLSKYPYSVGLKENEKFPSQQLFMSKYPISNVQIKNFFNKKYKLIEAVVSIDNINVLIYIMHPPSPKNKKNWNIRNEFLAKVNNSLISQKLPFILIGDLNISRYSNKFSDIFKKEHYNFNFLLNDYSWRAFCISYINKCLLMSEIDHTISSKNIFLKSKKTYKHYKNSDHYPLYSEFFIK